MTAVEGVLIKHSSNPLSPSHPRHFYLFNDFLLWTTESNKVQTCVLLPTLNAAPRLSSTRAAFRCSTLRLLSFRMKTRSPLSKYDLFSYYLLIPACLHSWTRTPSV